jgi:hypothetical protein
MTLGGKFHRRDAKTQRTAEKGKFDKSSIKLLRGLNAIGTKYF